MSERRSVMIVLKKEPGKDPVLTAVENTLSALQEAVDGYIETVTMADDFVVICNEEGCIQSLPYNCTLLGDIDLYGTILIAGMKDDEFTDVSIMAVKVAEVVLVDKHA